MADLKLRGSRWLRYIEVIYMTRLGQCKAMLECKI